MINLFLSACQSISNQTSLDQSALLNTQMGLAYLQKGALPNAKQKLLLALQENPHSPIVLDAMGYFCSVTKQPKQANQYYQQALIFNPQSGRALNNYGVFLCRHQKYRLADKYLLQAAHQENYLDDANAFTNAGLCALKIPNKKAAKRYFIKALAANPQQSTSYFELAELYYGWHQYNLAKKYLADYEQIAGSSAASLWLSICIARKKHDTTTVLRDGALLEKNFANSLFYQFYRKMQLS